MHCVGGVWMTCKCTLAYPSPAKGGLIVKKEWVLDSHVKKRRLPARK